LFKCSVFCRVILVIVMWKPSKFRHKQVEALLGACRWTRSTDRRCLWIALALSLMKWLWRAWYDDGWW
jgi:hypothetical protein